MIPHGPIDCFPINFHVGKQRPQVWVAQASQLLNLPAKLRRAGLQRVPIGVWERDSFRSAPAGGCSLPLRCRAISAKQGRENDQSENAHVICFGESIAAGKRKAGLFLSRALGQTPRMHRFIASGLITNLRRWTIFNSLALGLLGCAHTAPAPKNVRIALVSDTHVNRNGTNDDQHLYRYRFDKAISMVNTSKVDLVLFTGDLTQDGKPEQIDDFLAQIKKLSVPVFYVPGNHDVGNKIIPGKGGTVTEARVAQFEKILGPSFFAKTAAGVRVIGINSPILGSGFGREKEMWSFLEKELS